MYHHGQWTGESVTSDPPHVDGPAAARLAGVDMGTRAPRSATTPISSGEGDEGGDLGPDDDRPGEIGSAGRGRDEGRVLSFTLNGTPVRVWDPDPARTLLDWLRDPAVGLTGTKLVCGEGGCGACTVVVSQRDPRTGRLVDRAENACLRPLCSLEGRAVTTVEGVGSTGAGLHPVQERLVAANGSQCGFCSPGWVMNMVALLAEERAPSRRRVEDHFDGNLCRCTGYRPILDAMQSFAREDDTSPAPAPTGPSASAPATRLPSAPLDHPATERAAGAAARLDVRSGRHRWIRARSLEDVCALLVAHQASTATVKLVAGNTSVGLDRRTEIDPRVLVDVSDIAALRAIAVGSDRLRLGGGVTVAELIEVLDAVIAERAGPGLAGMVALRDHARHIGSGQIRARASLAGNLVLTRTHAESSSPFPSDLALVLAALEATVTIRPALPGRPERTVAVLELPAFDDLAAGYVLVAIEIPFARPGTLVRTYKVARRAQNAHALLNSAFKVVIDPATAEVVAARLVFGGIGALPLVAAAATSLVGQPWTWSTLDAVLADLRPELASRLVPMPDAGVSDAYRLSPAETTLYKCFVSVMLELDPGAVPPELASAGRRSVRAVSRGRTSFSVDPGELPVGAPIPSLSADIQVAGEARYTHDLPAPAGSAHGAYVYGEALHAAFDHSPVGGLDGVLGALRAEHPTVLAYVTVADIPAGGTNLFGPGVDDPVFADGVVTAFGAPIGLVLAPDEASALAGAAWVRRHAIAYTDLAPVATTIDQALALPDGAGLFADEPRPGLHLGRLHAVVRPGSDTGWLTDPGPEPARRFVQGQVRTGEQSHFYLETQAVLVVPGEQGRVTVFASSQDLASVQQYVAAVLGRRDHLVDARVLRLGGAFGGKETRPPYIAAAAAVAAARLGRPVRLVLDRTTDMRMIGGRHPYQGRYHASFDPDGTIDKLRLDYVADGGNTYDVTFPVNDLVLLSADNAYMVDTFGAYGRCARTNRMTRTAMRSFGVIQSTLVTETAIEHVAHELGLRPEDVRRRNLYADAAADGAQLTPYGQPLKYAVGRAVWDRLWAGADFERREADVRRHNAANRWTKRGISMVPVKYGVSYTYLTGNQGGALVTVCESDGSVVVATGGVEMGQGLATKVVQIAAEVLGIDMVLVRCADTATDVVPNASSTGASTGTDLNGGAVKEACLDLRTRLEAYCRAHESETGFPAWHDRWAESWPDVVGRAFGDRLDLSAQALYSSPDLVEVSDTRTQGRPFYYFSWSAAVSEVEIDALTGETTIVRSDVLYDAGRSLNPALDVGQVRGGFVQGIGNVTTEAHYYDARSGRPFTDGTWNYKPPCSKTIPVDFRVELLTYDRMNPHEDLPLDPYGIQSSKSTGEPPLVLACSVYFAIRHAVAAARADAGAHEWFELASPATVERIQQACLVRLDGPAPAPDRRAPVAER